MGAPETPHVLGSQVSPKLSFFPVTMLTGALLAGCAPQSAPWTRSAPDPHDREAVALEIRQNAQPPLIGLAHPDTLTVQCLRTGAVRMVIDWRQAMPTTDNPEHAWQPSLARDMTYRINRRAPQTLTFTLEIFERGNGQLSYRYVADERSEPRLLEALDAMSRGRSMRRFDVIREPRYILSPELGEFVAACHRSAPPDPL